MLNEIKKVLVGIQWISNKITATLRYDLGTFGTLAGCEEEANLFIKVQANRLEKLRHERLFGRV